MEWVSYIDKSHQPGDINNIYINISYTIFTTCKISHNKFLHMFNILVMQQIHFYMDFMVDIYRYFHIYPLYDTWENSWYFKYVLANLFYLNDFLRSTGTE